jgi:hypothetical protein
MPSEFADTKRLLGAGHKHDLEVIDAVPDQMPGAYRVVRWCKLCGAVAGMRRALASLARLLPSSAAIVSTMHDKIIVEA